MSETTPGMTPESRAGIERCMAFAANLREQLATFAAEVPLMDMVTKAAVGTEADAELIADAHQFAVARMVVVDLASRILLEEVSDNAPERVRLFELRTATNAFAASAEIAAMLHILKEQVEELTPEADEIVKRHRPHAEAAKPDHDTRPLAAGSIRKGDESAAAIEAFFDPEAKRTPEQDLALRCVLAMRSMMQALHLEGGDAMFGLSRPGGEPTLFCVRDLIAEAEAAAGVTAAKVEA